MSFLHTAVDELIDHQTSDDRVFHHAETLYSKIYNHYQRSAINKYWSKSSKWIPHISISFHTFCWNLLRTVWIKHAFLIKFILMRFLLEQVNPRREACIPKAGLIQVHSLVLYGKAFQSVSFTLSPFLRGLGNYNSMNLLILFPKKAS